MRDSSFCFSEILLRILRVKLKFYRMYGGSSYGGGYGGGKILFLQFKFARTLIYEN